jgi:hypothetical protein
MAGQRGRVAAQRRFRLFWDRWRTATTERERRHALVWWWLAEVGRMPAGKRASEMARLKTITAGLNGGECGDSQ